MLNMRLLVSYMRAMCVSCASNETNTEQRDELHRRHGRNSNIFKSNSASSATNGDTPKSHVQSRRNADNAQDPMQQEPAQKKEYPV